MASKNANDREARAARERLRAYQARQAVHEHTVRRRRRDNIIAGIGIAVIVVLAVATQLLYFQGPGKAAPQAAPSSTPSPSASCPPAADSANKGDVPAASVSECRTWSGTMTLNDVKLGIALDGAAAPQAVASTVSLVQKGFYTGLTCHRLTNGGFYVLQCGDPNGNGSGGPGYSYGPIENAPADNVYPAGTIAMARQGGDAASQGSQFFIVYKKTTIPSDAAGGYTVIGHVTSGLADLTSQITDKGVVPGTSASDGAPVVPTKITSITLQ
ncbi:peptidylprolyl isomerase [Microbacterium sp. STN6]|uniref:peptidylprolyl isomerase n=1 Tax=Microbacterium sp. STN6 TaxID=2995588 RepID=UPI002260BFC1|nr:peptidylprolyl isomerase [Microbacterium sp. STN6]MCX7521711.1 peptidylprolyl isomerase [Microbacterium sp. STN6]